MKTTTFKAAMLIVTAMMLLATLITAAPTADAKVPEPDRATSISVRTTYGGGDATCPDGALGVPGGCYIIVSKLLVLTFDNYWMYICPTGSIEDSLGECRKPVADAAAPGIYLQYAQAT